MDILLSSPSVPQLRPYQHQFITEIYEQIRLGSRRILGVAPTGAGKTVIASQIVAHAVSRNRRILFVVHRDILISQTADKFQAFGIDCGFIKSGRQENREALVQIASVQTLPRRAWWRDFPADVIVLDECHITAWAEVVQQMMGHTYPHAIYLGLTATPWRVSKREAMGDVFESLVCAPLPHELIDQGFLVKPSYFSIGETDLERVGAFAGEFDEADEEDFDEAQLAIICDRPELIQQLVQDWRRLAFGRRSIAFAVNVSHSQHICEAFQAAGIPSAHVDGDTPFEVRQRIYRQLAAAEILVLSSCMSLGEGFDCPAVSAVLLCRPTKSKALYFQQVGRGLRLSPETNKRDCVVLDQAGNVPCFRYIEELREITLELSKAPSCGEGAMKICPNNQGRCGAILYAFQMRCPQCGYLFLSRKVALVTGLEHYLSQDDVERWEFYRQKIQAAYLNAFSPGWAAVIFKDHFGHWPPDAWAFGAVFGNCPTDEKKQRYYDYLRAIAQRKEKPESWVNRYMLLEFG